jgi:hypothetical protein
MKPITFCINTAANEINHVKLLFQSLQENLSSKEHELMVFIDSDNQNTFEWLLTQKSIFPNLKILKNNLPICYGYARNINEMFKRASNDIVSYLQSDMVICKDYDIEVLKRLEPGMVLCSTRIEPPLHGNSGEKVTYDFGLDPTKFNLKEFTEYVESIKMDRITEYFFAPFTMHKEVWNSIGGHDTLFRRSREDSDILTRLVLNNIQIKQTWSAMVYHFTCTSSRGPNWFDKSNTQAQQRAQLQQTADQIELSRFNTKWGSFNHQLTKVKHYNIAAYITGKDFNMLEFEAIQNHFHRVYVDDTITIQLMQEMYDRMHSPANTLLNISDSDWNEYGYMYNRMKAVDRIKHISDVNHYDDVVIRFKLEDLTPQLYQDFICNSQQIIDQVEGPGEFEYECFNITVYDKVDRASDNIIVTNPEIKLEHLYTIH